MVSDGKGAAKDSESEVRCVAIHGLAQISEKDDQEVIELVCSKLEDSWAEIRQLSGFPQKPSRAHSYDMNLIHFYNRCLQTSGLLVCHTWIYEFPAASAFSSCLRAASFCLAGTGGHRAVVAYLLHFVLEDSRGSVYDCGLCEARAVHCKCKYRFLFSAKH
jgi:hypothetical protein